MIVGRPYFSYLIAGSRRPLQKVETSAEESGGERRRARRKRKVRSEGGWQGRWLTDPLFLPQWPHSATAGLQMADIQDIEQEMEPLDFDPMLQITITFTPTERDIKVKDEAALSAIVAHLNRLEGVDLEPDFISKSASGPWEILVSADCANQFRATFKYATNFQMIGINTPITIKYLMLDDKVKELPQASSKTRPRRPANCLQSSEQEARPTGGKALSRVSRRRYGK